MSSAAAALVLGALAGLAVAMPVGPVGVLLLRTGLLQGTRVAVGAAAGIATVDAGYAALAVAAGAPVGRIAEAHADVARLLSSGVLLVVGVVALSGWWRDRPSTAPATSIEPTSIEPTSVEPTSVEPTSVEPTSVEPGSVEPGRPYHLATVPSTAGDETNLTVAAAGPDDRHVGLVDPGSSRAGGVGGVGGAPAGRAAGAQERPTRRAVLGAYGRFVGLTAVNPLTAVTFATVAVGLAARVGERPGVAGATAFVVGAAVASLVWQLVLAVVSGGLGGRLGPVGRSRTSLVGALVVVGLAVVVAAG